MALHGWLYPLMYWRFKMSKDLERIIATMKSAQVNLDGKNDYKLVDSFVRSHMKIALTNGQIWKVIAEYNDQMFGTADF